MVCRPRWSGAATVRRRGDGATNRRIWSASATSGAATASATGSGHREQRAGDRARGTPGQKPVGAGEEERGDIGVEELPGVGRDGVEDTIDVGREVIATLTR